MGFSSLAQTEEQRTTIIKDYDLSKLEELKERFTSRAIADKERATAMARIKGWPLKLENKDGSFSELQRITEDGHPIYYTHFNAAAARSTRANFMHNGGGLGLNVEGQGMTAYVWDGGPTRLTHEDFSNRVTIGDGVTVLNSNSFHAQHVTGTIVGEGLGMDGNSRESKGMAPQASAVTHDWNNDIAEATTAAMSGMILSNHSYGSRADQLPDWAFGAYLTSAREWDELMYNAPYYLMVVAAGNDGNNDSDNAAPLSGDSSYDKLSTHAVAKNNLVVANGQDASILATGVLNTVTRNPGSSEGPTDDLRIKPDIMGNGTSLLSAWDTGDNVYNVITGTSMASPNVCGSLLLLQQHYNNIHGSFMRAATLKGLALHTADDVNPTNTNNGTTVSLNGPDATTGWGLMNTKVAAETINNDGLQSWISEEELSQGETFTMTVESDGINPLMASISWTDVGENSPINNTGIANDPTIQKALINDLDIRITQGGSTFNPWKLTSVNTNAQADNTVDPFERVDVTGASGTYTITVTHKGALTTGSQRFSLIVTGLSSNIALIKKTDNQIICSNNDAVYNFDYKQIGGGTSNLSAANVPAGVSVNFSQNSFSADGNFDVTFGNLSSVAVGTYDIDIIADSGTETEIRTIGLQIYHPTFNAIPLVSPTDGNTAESNSILLQWNSDANAEDYVVQVATTPDFSSFITNETVMGTSHFVTGLTPGNVYYWRVLGQNRCALATNYNMQSFQVGALNCNTVNQNSPTTITDQSTVTSAVIVTNAVTIGDVNVTVDFTHTWIGDVGLTLISPAGTRVDLINILTCTDQTNFNFRFDDDAANTINCAAGNTNYPALSIYKPVSQLFALNGEASNGLWTLEITDGGPGDTGTVQSWSLEICETNQFATQANFVNNGFAVDVNSTYTAVTGDIEATTPSETAAQQVYTLVELPAVGDLRNGGITMAVGNTFTQNDVDTGQITYVNVETVTFADQFKVDISNAAGGWLPNQIVPINGALGVNEFELGDLAIWPVPTDRILNIQINTATNENVNVNLFDLHGRRVFNTSLVSNAGTFNQAIDLGTIAKGVYLLDVQQGNKKTTKRIVIGD